MPGRPDATAPADTPLSRFWSWLKDLDEAVHLTEADLFAARLTRLEARVATLERAEYTERATYRPAPPLRQQVGG